MTITFEAPIPSYDLPMDLSDKADAANAALRAGYDIWKSAREAWDLVKETFPGERTRDQWTPAEHCARRLAVRLEQATRRAYGVVSDSACGTIGVTKSGRVCEVDATSGASDYFDGVQWIEYDGKQWTNGRYDDEAPVSEFVAFFDTREQVVEALYPTPRPSSNPFRRHQA